MAEGDRLIKGGVRKALKHDSAVKHVAGRAAYIDDLPEPPGLLHLYAAMSPHAHARILSADLSAVRAAPGVMCVLTADDIPGENNVGPVRHDDPIFALSEKDGGLVEYHGQCVFAVAATSLAAAKAAAAKARIEYEPLPAVLTIEEALEAGTDLEPEQVMRLGDSGSALKNAPHRLEGRLAIGGQDHFYLEGQVALAIPGEDGDMLVYSSTQNPSEVQHLVAHALGRPNHAVSVDVRRMGGGFGGKETQPALLAAIAALVSDKTGRPAKFRLDRDDDMIMTGKRHDFLADWRVGFDDAGRLEAVEIDLASRCGYSTDLSMAINDRAMFHADNAYFLNNATIRSRRLKTNTVSNTAFRGFGGPQGMLVIERIMDEIARHLGRDPYAVRLANLYGVRGDQTPYHQRVQDQILDRLMPELADKADYASRRQAVAAFNAQNRWLKKGISLTPVKFGISFTTTHLNQAGALVHVYQDGSVMLNHGGTEMGQGLFVKVAQIVAEEFQIDLDRVKITGTSTAKVPNTSATAASSGTDLNGMAAKDAAAAIKARLTDFAAERFQCGAEDIIFAANRVTGGGASITFDELVKQAYLARISLSSTGFYKTPEIHYDRANHRGYPFYYYAYGAAVSEVVIDTLTGEYRVLRTDLLHDTGRSINPAIDLGQIEGGFLQGLGWLTMEELVFDAEGRLRTHAPSTYKIPCASDRPDVLNMDIWQPGENRAATIHRSKAVGEPPFMLAISVFSALSDAVASIAGHKLAPPLDAPATPEAVLMAVRALQDRSAQGN